MRTTQLFLTSILVLASAACSSSSSSTGSPTTDTGTGTDTAGGGDTGVPTDSSPGDTKPATDAKADSKPATDTAPPPPDCDPVKQTGCSGATSKCTAIDDGAGATMPGCMKPGTAAVDAPCTRTSETPAGIGDDTCAPGSYCSGIGTLTSPPTRHCRKFCTDDKGCATGQKCSILISDGSDTPLFGICVPTCTVFGTDCTGGMNCSVLIGDMDGTALYGTCRAVGTTAAGSSCTDASACAADLICNDPTSSGTDTCNALCDSAHACTGGKTCKAAGGLPSGGGLCQ